MSINPLDYKDDPEKYHRAVIVQTLMDHADHKIEIALYGDRTNPHNAAFECTDCGTTLIDWDHPLIDAEASLDEIVAAEREQFPESFDAQGNYIEPDNTDQWIDGALQGGNKPFYSDAVIG